MKQTNTNKNLSILRYLLMLLLAIVFLFPLYWMFIGALKTTEEIFAMPPVFIPSRWEWNNFSVVFKEVPFTRWILNSTFVASTVTVLALLFHSMAAYSLARLNYPGRRILFGLIIGTLLIPFCVITVPLFILIRTFGWMDTYWALIFPAIPNAFGIFLLHQFYLGIPKSLEEAATIDGCSKAGIFFRIIVPLSRPILSALGVFFFIANWNSFLWPLLVINSRSLMTVQVGLAGFAGQYYNPWATLMAANTIAIMPNIVLFLLLQKYLIRSVALSGIKG